MLRGNPKEVEEVVVRAVYMCTEKEGRTLDLGSTQGLKTLGGRYTPTMSSLISAASWYVSELFGRFTASLIYINSRVKRGVAAQHPRKYDLDEKELERVSALARIEIEDARTMLERATEVAKEMGKDIEADDADDRDGEDDENAWVE